MSSSGMAPREKLHQGYSAFSCVGKHIMLEADTTAQAPFLLLIHDIVIVAASCKSDVRGTVGSSHHQYVNNAHANQWNCVHLICRGLPREAVSDNVGDV